MSVVSVIVLAGLCVAGLRVYLRLRAPDQYREFTQSPIAFLGSRLLGVTPARAAAVPSSSPTSQQAASAAANSAASEAGAATRHVDNDANETE